MHIKWALFLEQFCNYRKIKMVQQISIYSAISSPIINIQHYYSTFVTVNELTLLLTYSPYFFQISLDLT